MMVMGALPFWDPALALATPPASPTSSTSRTAAHEPRRTSRSDAPPPSLALDSDPAVPAKRLAIAVNLAAIGRLGWATTLLYAPWSRLRFAGDVTVAMRGRHVGGALGVEFVLAGRGLEGLVVGLRSRWLGHSQGARGRPEAIVDVGFARAFSSLYLSAAAGAGWRRRGRRPSLHVRLLLGHVFF